MKKITLLFSTAMMLVCTSFAQDSKITFSVGPAISLPTGNFSDINSVGLGAEFTASISVMDNIELFGQTGLHYFSGKKISAMGMSLGKTDAMMHFPFLMGARISSDALFGGVGLGYGIYEDLSGFTFSPHVGYKLENFDLMLHYTSSSVGGANLGYMGLKAFYRLN